MRTDMAVIPGGLTSVLQPLDVCLNKPFKDRLRKMWVEWMTSGLGTLTKGTSIRHADGHGCHPGGSHLRPSNTRRVPQQAIQRPSAQDVGGMDDVRFGHFNKRWQPPETRYHGRDL